MDCLEKKIQVYVALHLSCASSFPDIGFDGLLPVAEAAQQSSVDRCFDEPEDFVEAVRSLVSIESALLGDEGPLQFLVQEGVIQDGKLDGYEGAVDELQAAIDDLDDHSIDSEGTQEVARLANVVSMHAALLAPLAPAAHSYGIGLSKSLDEQDVRVIDGIGPYYAWKLKAANVKTVSQLGELAPSSQVSGVPSEKLTWFRHQANVVTGVKIDAEVFAPLLNFTVSEVLSREWNYLQVFFEEDEHRAQAEPMFAQLIEDLRTLPGALDDTFLGYCRLRDLGAVTQDD
jgi:hypothetical protein